MDPTAKLREILQALLEDRHSYSLSYDEVTGRIEALANWIAEDGAKPEHDDHTGSGWEDVIAGAYWFATDWHDGPESDLFRLQKACGRVYVTGPLAHGPDVEAQELAIYKALEDLYASEHEF